ncbi:MAG: nucleoside monophosphate kinase [Opitutaceae bacterium]
MPAIPHTFSPSDHPVGAKLLYFGATGVPSARPAAEARSLKIEHVSPETLVHQEICRRTPLGQQAAQARQHGAAVPDQTLLAIFRKWFWARKPDAGFLLEGFPATLLHARVFDEWLEAREEALTSCLCAEPAAQSAVVEHYRTLGLLREPAPTR